MDAFAQSFLMSRADMPSNGADMPCSSAGLPLTYHSCISFYYLSLPAEMEREPHVEVDVCQVPKLSHQVVNACIPQCQVPELVHWWQCPVVKSMIAL